MDHKEQLKQTIRPEQKMFNEMFAPGNTIEDAAEYAKKAANESKVPKVIELAIRSNNGYKKTVDSIKKGAAEYNVAKERFKQIETEELPNAIEDVFNVKKRKSLDDERAKLKDIVTKQENLISTEAEYWTISVGAWALSRLTLVPTDAERLKIIEMSGDPKIFDGVAQTHDKLVAKWIEELKRSDAVTTPLVVAPSDEVSSLLDKNKNYSTLFDSSTKLTEDIAKYASDLEYISSEITAVQKTLKERMIPADKRAYEARIKGKIKLNREIKRLYDDNILKESDSLGKQQADLQAKLEDAKSKLKQTKEDIAWYGTQAELVYFNWTTEKANASREWAEVKKSKNQKDDYALQHAKEAEGWDKRAEDNLARIGTFTKPPPPEKSDLSFSVNTTSQSTPVSSGGSPSVYQYVNVGAHYRNPVHKLNIDFIAGISVYPTDTQSYNIQANVKREGLGEVLFRNESSPTYDRRLFGIHGVSYGPFTNLSLDTQRIEWNLGQVSRVFSETAFGDQFTRLWHVTRQLGDNPTGEWGAQWKLGTAHWQDPVNLKVNENISVVTVGPAYKYSPSPKSSATFSVAYSQDAFPDLGRTNGWKVSADFNNILATGSKLPLNGRLEYTFGRTQSTGQSFTRIQCSIDLKLAEFGTGATKK